jgi:pimeloyl-ACP methyl ester carboxylesterase
MGLHIFRSIHRAALWVIPHGGHSPIFADAAPQFTQTALEFLR